MLTRFKTLFAPPVIGDPEQNIVAQQLHYVFLAGIPIALIFPVIVLESGQTIQHMIGSMISGLMAVIMAILFWFLKRGKVKFVSTTLICSIFISVLISIVFGDGIRDQNVMILIMLLILTSVFLGGRATTIFGILNALALTGVFLMERKDMLYREMVEPSSIDTLITVLASIFLTTIFLRLTVEQIIKDSEHIRQQTVELEKNNRELTEGQEALEEQTAVLSSLHEDLKRAQNHLIESEKMAALGELVAGVAHEVNTPLGIGVTAASTLSEETFSLVEKFNHQKLKRAELTTYLGVAKQSSKLILENLIRASELVQSFKQVSVDETDLEQRTFELKPYLNEVIDSLQPHLRQGGHRITVVGGDRIVLHSFPTILAQILTNFVTNSVNHAYPKGQSGHLQIEISQHIESVRIQYCDDGSGIPDEYVKRIFEPFFTTARGQGGTGLGLHIVYNLVTQRLGGTIRCQSTVGKGTRFMIDLPQ